MKQINVAVGVVKNTQGEILISLRHDYLHQGGLWEFPGGKIEAGETAEQALKRELFEELAIEVLNATPLITINHSYPDLAVQLRVFLVTEFAGLAQSCEGQVFRWVLATELNQYDFPAANQPIITAAQLPDCYAILDDSEPVLLEQHLQMLLAANIKLIQARLKNLSAADSEAFLHKAYALCQQHNVTLLTNSAVKGQITTDGVHLTSLDLLALSKRPEHIRWLAASCHNLEELKQAERIGVDFVVLAPVLATKTHPHTSPLGWQCFADWVSQCNLPVYALGGQSKATLSLAQHAGARGIAAIRAFLM